MAKSLQKRMYTERSNNDLFKTALSHALEYKDQALDRNVYPTAEAIDNLKIFEESLNEETVNAEDVLEKLHRYGSPATVSQTGGRYFGFVNGGVVPAGLAAKNLSIYWDQNSAMQVLSPISSKLEVVVEKWLKDLFGFPDQTVAGFVSGTSMANFCGLAAARYRVLQKQGWNITDQGLFDAPRIRIITGREAHSTVLKAVSMVGLGKANIEWVDVDDQGRIVPDKIPALDETCILILQAGNVNSGSFDPFESICKKAKEAGAWIHIDGAFGLWAGATKSMNQLTRGFEHADSWAVDGHKTLNTPYDSGIVLCSDPEALVASLHMTGGYIITGDERDGMFFTPEMSRRARVIELWATMKYLGKNGIDEMVHGLHKRAVQFAEEIKLIEGFEVLNDVVFNQVLVSCKNDELTEKVISRIQELRECWVGGSTWKGKKVIRISICSWATTEEDIRITVNSFEKALKLETEGN